MVRWSQAIDNWYSVLESQVIYSFYIFIDSSCEINSLLEYQLAVGLTYPPPSSVFFFLFSFQLCYISFLGVIGEASKNSI